MIAVPPIGIIPRYIHDERRLKELTEAMNRYTKAGIPIPCEWVDEYAYITVSIEIQKEKRRKL